MYQAGLAVLTALIVLALPACRDATSPNTVRLRISGQVTSEGGSPVPGATIAFLATEFYPVYEIKTLTIVSGDAAGRYQLSLTMATLDCSTNHTVRASTFELEGEARIQRCSDSPQTVNIVASPRPPIGPFP